MTGPRVCVVGAGAAGIATSRLLHQRGYDVTLLEKTDRVGGMCRTIHYTDPGKGERAFDVGANYVTKDYREVRALVDELGLNLMTDTAFQHQSALDVRTRTIRNGPDVVNEGISKVSFLCASVRYLWLQWRNRKIIREPGFAGVAKNPDLLRPFDQWLDAHDLQPLQRLFLIPITAFGYGPLDQVPTPAALKYIDSGRFLSMLSIGLFGRSSWPKRVVEGFGTLMEKAAERLAEGGVTILTGVEIDAITRAPGRVEVSARVGGEPLQLAPFDRLVVAMLPDQAVPLLDATDDERTLFAPGVIQRRDFRITTAEVTGFDYQVVLELQAEPHMRGTFPGIDDNPGHPWIFGRQWPDSQLLLFYANVPHETPEDAVVDQAAADCDAAMSDQHQPGTWQGVHTYQRWPEYFPHVSVEDMRDFRGSGEGWYDLVEGLQGRNETYWIHGVVAYELVESIMEYARVVVERSFPEVRR